MLGNLSLSLDGSVGLNGCGSLHLHEFGITWGYRSSVSSYLRVSHAYALPGSYKVCVTVTDTNGLVTTRCLRAVVP